jgi:hypothetical protein
MALEMLAELCLELDMFCWAFDYSVGPFSSFVTEAR